MKKVLLKKVLRQKRPPKKEDKTADLSCVGVEPRLGLHIHRARLLAGQDDLTERLHVREAHEGGKKAKKMEEKAKEKRIRP